MRTNFQFLLLLSISAQRCFAVTNQKVSEYPSLSLYCRVSWFAGSKLIFLVFCFYKMSLIIAKFVRLLIFSCLRANSTFYTSKIPAGRGLFNHKNSSSLLFSLRFFDFLIEPQTIKSHLQLNDLLWVCLEIRTARREVWRLSLIHFS